MATLILHTNITAPIEACFDGARDIDLHCRCSVHTGERAIAGVTNGLMGLGDTVTFEAVHFGVRQRLSGAITEFDRPHCFVDEMTKGAFKSFRHTHEFITQGDKTLMRDTLVWESPMGILGQIADAFLMRRHMRRYMRRKNRLFKRIVEAESRFKLDSIDAKPSAG